MEKCIKKMIEETQQEIQRIEGEIKELSCELKPHPDDVVLCEKLMVRLDCNKRFFTKLTSCYLKR